MEELSLLILGAGWTATFLIPLLQSRKIPFAATTTTGHPVAGVPTILFKFEPSVPEDEIRSAIATLPRARYILITFPIVGTGPSKVLVSAYSETHRTATATTDDNTDTFRFIQLGSTGIWQQQSSDPQSFSTPTHPTSTWLTRHSPLITPTPRSAAEDELLSLGGCVLNLSGLWGGSRTVRNWAKRVAPTKEAVRTKKSLHLIHGADIARVVVAILNGGDEMWERSGRGQRWMVTDGFVYDWWALLVGWADTGDKGVVSEQAGWVFELMREEGVRGLPRAMEVLGRCYDTREFWEAFGLVPSKGRVY
ncbi:hypothetical protein N657DRAFT_647555 [Parathielavia appendiculata]|uniref:Uncharacterized protein n=1 Tax=Parathielavia appendiculata TaxID=2587402 RepID=A0AAN6Z231_9PEZI|nr:hypothetical protein N657DRAFT_647555 [Parathielavia appendiculata]